MNAQTSPINCTSADEQFSRITITSQLQPVTATTYIQSTKSSSNNGYHVGSTLTATPCSSNFGLTSHTTTTPMQQVPSMSTVPPTAASLTLPSTSTRQNRNQFYSPRGSKTSLSSMLPLLSQNSVQFPAVPEAAENCITVRQHLIEQQRLLAMNTRSDLPDLSTQERSAGEIASTGCGKGYINVQKSTSRGTVRRRYTPRGSKSRNCLNVSPQNARESIKKQVQVQNFSDSRTDTIGPSSSSGMFSSNSTSTLPASSEGDDALAASGYSASVARISELPVFVQSAISEPGRNITSENLQRMETPVCAKRDYSSYGQPGTHVRRGRGRGVSRYSTINSALPIPSAEVKIESKATEIPRRQFISSQKPFTTDIDPSGHNLNSQIHIAQLPSTLASRQNHYGSRVLHQTVNQPQQRFMHFQDSSLQFNQIHNESNVVHTEDVMMQPNAIGQQHPEVGRQFFAQQQHPPIRPDLHDPFDGIVNSTLPLNSPNVTIQKRPYTSVETVRMPSTATHQIVQQDNNNVQQYPQMAVPQQVMPMLIDGPTLHQKYKCLQKSVKSLALINAALFDETQRLVQRIATTGEERRMLARRLQHHERNKAKRVMTKLRKQAQLDAQCKKMKAEVNIDRNYDSIELVQSLSQKSNSIIDDIEEDFDKISSSETQSHSASTSASRVVTPELSQEPLSPLRVKKLRIYGRKQYVKQSSHQKPRGGKTRRRGSWNVSDC